MTAKQFGLGTHSSQFSWFFGWESHTLHPNVHTACHFPKCKPASGSEMVLKYLFCKKNWSYRPEVMTNLKHVLVELKWQVACERNNIFSFTFESIHACICYLSMTAFHMIIHFLVLTFFHYYANHFSPTSHILVCC